MRRLTLVILALSVSVLLRAQQEDSIFISRIATEVLLNGKAYDNLRDLTKKIGARLTGSPQMSKAEKWGQQVLQNSGADKVWMQQCMVPHWVRGGKDEATAYYLRGNPQVLNVNRIAKSLDILALGNSLGTGQKAVQAELLEVKSFDDLEAKKDQVKGKIVFYSYKFSSAFISPFNSYRDAVT
ncbi:MAG: peptidase M28 family protein, partial [Chitinophagaceae bacterium]